MEFDKSRVYTALNADELKVGSSIIAADNLSFLRRSVKNNADTVLLEGIKPDDYEERFFANDFSWSLAYLVSAPGEKELKWTDLKVGDVIKKKLNDRYRFALVEVIDTYDEANRHVYAANKWLADEELADWEKADK